MRDDIDKERRFMLKAYAKREAQLSAMVDSTIGMVGDLQGIMGQAMPEIAAIDEPPILLRTERTLNALACDLA
jgi:hypothetical protein